MFDFSLCIPKMTRPQRFFKSLRSFLLMVFLLYSVIGLSQNILQKQLPAEHIKTISINGNQIFNISVSTSKTDKINITSTLDGEYQNDFQLDIKEDEQTLNLSLAHFSFMEIPDDKRNAHKVIAATLQLEIPEELELNIQSDIASVDVIGNYKSLYIELLQGKCNIEGVAKTATINTLDGDINVITQNATIEANSNHGEIIVDEFEYSEALWKLKSINGTITVAKPN